jgi:hypothetical protein
MGRTVLVCEPAEPGTGPVELGRLKAGVGAVTVLPDGRVVTGGYDYQVRLRNVRAAHPALCAHAPRTRSLVPSPHLELASSSVTQWAEFSCREVRPAAQNAPGARQRARNAMHQQT